MNERRIVGIVLSYNIYIIYILSSYCSLRKKSPTPRILPPHIRWFCDDSVFAPGRCVVTGGHAGSLFTIESIFSQIETTLRWIGPLGLTLKQRRRGKKWRQIDIVNGVVIIIARHITPPPNCFKIRSHVNERTSGKRFSDRNMISVWSYRRRRFSSRRDKLTVLATETLPSWR